MLFLSLLIFYLKNSSRNTIRVSNSLVRPYILSDLGSYQQMTLFGGAFKSFFVECLQIQSKDESTKAPDNPWTFFLMLRATYSLCFIQLICHNIKD